jgi:hypothetical protein
MFIITGSRITAATCPSLSESACSTAPASLKGTTITVSHSARGMPFEVGSVVYQAWPSAPVWNRMSRTSASGTTENSTESWCPW